MNLKLASKFVFKFNLYRYNEDGHVNPIMTCQLAGCRAKTCYAHNVPWHEGRTCAEFDAEAAAANDEEEAAKVLRLRNVKQCPKCKFAIEKDGGCSHMRCTPPGGCGAEFCRQCLADYNGGTYIQVESSRPIAWKAPGCNP
jgi:hypothetical protein